MSLLCAIN